VAEERDRLLPGALLDLVHLLGDEVQRELPLHLAELPLAALAGADHRRRSRSGSYMNDTAALAAGAQHPAALGVLRVAVDLVDDPVDRPDDHPAVPRTHVADVVGGLTSPWRYQASSSIPAAKAGAPRIPLVPTAPATPAATPDFRNVRRVISSGTLGIV
jgi:hypothetical protein